MNFALRLLPFAILPLLAFYEPMVPAQEDDPVYIDEEKKEFIEKIERCRASSDWKGLFDLQAQATHPKKAHKLVRLPGPEPRYVGLQEYVNRRYADLPAEALQYYRGQFDGAAKLAFNNAKAAGDRAGLEKVVETWFYSSRTDDALDLLANLHAEEGRLGMAIHCWTRLLHHYPDSEIPRAITAARLARAAAASGQDSILEGVRQYAKERKLEGEVIAGEGPISLADFLKSLKVDVVAAAPSSVPRDPSVGFQASSADLRLVGVRPEIRRWSTDLTGGPEPSPQRGGRGGMPAGPPVPDFPYLPAFARVDGHEMVVFSNGIRVTIIDPRRANSAKPEEGVYFSYPPPGETILKATLPPNFQGDGRMISWMRPYIGVAIDGEMAFATLYSTKRQKDTAPVGGMGIQDTLYGMTRMICLNLRTQQVVWDTDFGDAGTQFRKMEFWEKNFSFSGPPIVKGDRVYAGIGTSPLGEEESRVICFDRRTGMPQWERFLASVNIGRNMWWGLSSLTSRLTILEEDKGAIIAHSNLGVLAALDGVTGNVRWLSKYARTNTGPDRGQAPQIFSRPASPLVIYRGKIYALPQDATDLLIADAATGSIQKDAPKIETALGARSWRDFPRLIGRMGDYLVIGGTGGDSCILNTTSSQFHGLPATNTSGTGRGMIDGETLYIPCGDGGKGGLGMFHGQRQWVAFERSVLWWPLGEGGNVVRGGNYLLFASSSKLSIFTDTEVVRAEFRRRLDQNPPNPSAWLDYGMLMRGNERWAEAARGYLNFIDAVKGDPEWLDESKKVQIELHGIFLKLGAEAMTANRPVDAAAHYKNARDFAWDGPTLTEATRLLAGSCEKVAETRPDAAEGRTWARQAVEEYQKLILKAPAGFVKPTEAMMWIPIREYASTRIGELVRKHGAEAYEGVSWAAEEELKRARQDPAALRKVAELYPQSGAAAEALKRVSSLAAEQGRWTAAASALREMRERLWNKWTPADQKRLIEAVEKCGDAERMEAEVKRMERLFEKNAKLGTEENAPTVEDYLAKARPAAAALARRPVAPPPGSIATLSTWDPPSAAADSYQLPVGFELIVPGGLDPVKWPADVEFFARGSAVELWNIRTKKRSWTAPHPGGWIGVVYGDGEDDESGVRVMEVRAGSPAERAGIQAGDVIRSVDGVAVSTEDFDLATEAKDAGTRFTVVLKRGEESRTTDVTSDPWPQAARPGIIGAVFTSEGALAVAWEDVVAAFDANDGKLLWTSRPGRDRFSIREIHVAWERILVHERYTPDRCRSSMRTGAVKEALPPEDQQSRVIGLDERTGAPRWALGLRFEPQMAGHHSAQFLGRPLESMAGVIVTGVQNARSVELVPISVEDGREGSRVVLSGTGGQPGAAWFVEPVSGMLWNIDSMVQGEAKLRSYSGADFSKGIEIGLKNVDPTASGYGLAATEDRVAVVSVSRSPGPPRLSVYSARDGSLIAATKAGEGPLKDRVMPVYAPSTPERKLISGIVSIAPDGQVLIYTEIPSRDPKVPTSRAVLTALTAADGEFKLAWDQVATRVTRRGLDDRDVVTVRSGPKSLFITSHHGIPPGKSEEATVLTFLNREEGGRIRKVVDDLVIPIDTLGQPGDPTPSRRGRIFLNRKTGLEILGD